MSRFPHTPLHSTEGTVVLPRPAADPQPPSPVIPAGPLVGGAEIMDGATEVDLTEDPFADDLDRELAARANRTWVTARSTVVLAAVVLLVTGFAAGTLVEKYYGRGITRTAQAQQDQAARVNTLASRFAGARGGGDNQAGGLPGGAGPAPGTTVTPAPGGAAAGTSVSGTVKLVDGSTVYVQTADGGVFTVRTSAGTSVAGTANGKVSDLVAGNAVTVTGTTTAESTVTATKITKTG